MRETSMKTTGHFVGPHDEEALRAAQELMYDAWEASGEKRRISLAKKALKVCDLCADAYVLLASEAAETLEEELRYYQRGVAAGEEALGSGPFKNDVGYFWGLLETRPYMRARAGLAECLWELDRREEAVAHLWDLLRLNPDDNQGLRYLLLSKLFAVDDLDGVERILAEYEEEGFANWSYSRALLLFKRHGPSEAAVTALKAAVKCNGYVPNLLSGMEPMPMFTPSHYTQGSREEAIIYAMANKENWAAAEGALAWLAKHPG